MKQDIGYYQEFGDLMMLNSRNVWSDHRLTADKRLRFTSPKLPSCLRPAAAGQAGGNFFYPRNVI